MMQKRNLKPKKGRQQTQTGGVDFSQLSDVQIGIAVQQSAANVLEASAELQQVALDDFSTISALTAAIGFEYRFSSECYGELARRQQARRVSA